MGNKHHCHIFSCFLRQENGKVVHPLVVVEPSLGYDLVDSACYIINICFGRGYSDSDVANVVFVHGLSQWVEPHRAVLDGCHLVALTVKGDDAFDIHVLLALFCVKDVDSELVLA